MKLTNTKSALLATLAGLALTVSSQTASAALDTTYNTGDLIMGFQVDGGTQVLMVNLGNSTQYRDTTTNILNIGNINSSLQTITGGNSTVAWYDNTSLYFGVAGVRTESSTNNSANASFTGATGIGDPNSTPYYSRERDANGTVGEANSITTGPQGGNITTFSASVAGLGTPFNANDVNGEALIATGIGQSWDTLNPIGAPAFNNQLQTPGSQYQFDSPQFDDGDFAGYQTDGNGTVAGALDLWRLPRYVNGVATPDYTANVASYQGSFIIDQDGDISFIVVPEPSTMALAGLGAIAAVLFIRRRRSAALEA